MYSRPIVCSTPGCGDLAEYKIAAAWSAGKFSELKTYGISCPAHFASTFQAARARRKDHPPSEEEAQGELGSYRFEKGKAGAPLKPVANPV